MNKSTIRYAIGAAILLVSACAGGGANTTAPSTYDLLFRHDELEAHLAGQRALLAELRARLAGLEDAVAASLAELDEAQFQLIASRERLERQSVAAADLRREIAAALEATRETRATIFKLKQERRNLETEIDQKRAEEGKNVELLAILDERVDALDGQVNALTRTNARLIEAQRDIVDEAV
ncbi:MAG: hypothetical protein AAGA72_05265 [Pseudomonadota bacterium]